MSHPLFRVSRFTKLNEVALFRIQVAYGGRAWSYKDRLYNSKSAAWEAIPGLQAARRLPSDDELTDLMADVCDRSKAAGSPTTVAKCKL